MTTSRRHRAAYSAGASLAASLLLASVALGASSATPRSGDYYEIWCHSAADNSQNLWKRVSAKAIQPDKAPGGNDTAVGHFNANNPYGESCRIEGPFGA